MDLILLKDNKEVNITYLVESIEWSGDESQGARKLTVSILNANKDKIDIKTGSFLHLYGDNRQELFRGSVFTRGKSYNGVTVDYTAFDRGIYLLKNEDCFNFRNVSAENVAITVCNKFGIPYSNIESTGFNINKKFIGVNLHDIIMTAYSLASAKNKKYYMLRFIEGKLNILEKDKTVLGFDLKTGENIIDSSYSDSIEDMVNNALVVDQEGNVVTNISNSEDIAKYGSFQKVLKKEEGKDYLDTANETLQGITQTLTIENLGNVTCLTGYAINVKDNKNNLKGKFYIAGDSHKWTGGLYTNSLTLNFKGDMNIISSGEDFDDE